MSQKTITVVVVAMLLLAGCATSTTPTSPSSTETSPDESTPNEQPTTTPTDTDEVVDDEQAIQDAELTDHSQPITNDTRRVMTALSQNFYEDLPVNETQRKNETVQAAHTLCEESKPIDDSVFEVSGEFDRQSYRLYHATNTINDHFNQEVSTKKLQTSMSDVGSISKYTPLVGGYNRMYEAACAVDPDDDESIEQFYIATASFGVEAALVQQQVFFKSSFAATRYTTNKLSLMKVRTVTGDKGYGMLLSEIHWAYRGGQASAASYVFSKSADLGINVSDMDRDTIHDTANETYEEYKQDTNRSIDSGKQTADNTTQIIEECAEASQSDGSDSLWNRATDTIKDFESSLEDISTVDPSDIPDDVNESIEDSDEFISCLEERDDK